MAIPPSERRWPTGAKSDRLYGPWNSHRCEIPRAFAAAGARLILEAAGDSMIGAATADRDVLFVKPTNNISEAARKIVVCRLGADEYVKHLDVRNGHIRLLSRNERHGRSKSERATNSR